jgi:hypothetical protein
MAQLPLQTFTIRTFADRIIKDINNGFPDSDFSMTENEIIFHIDQARAAAMTGNVFNLAKVQGVLEMPEGYLTTVLVDDLTKNENTGEWQADLWQPPTSLPLGYSMPEVYFASSAYAKKDTVLPIESKRVAYRDYMPHPSGSSYRVAGQTIYVKASNGQSLLNKKLYVVMAKTRTINGDEYLNWPDDQIDVVYNMVMDKLKKRIMNPQDIIQDGLPAGNKSS